MPPVTPLAILKNYLGQAVTMHGWLMNFRSSGSIAFLQLRDGSGFVQGVMSKKEVGEAVWKETEKLRLEASVEVTGVPKQDSRSPWGYELEVKDLKVLQASEDYPIGKKEHGPDFLLDQRHLWIRSPRQWAVLRVRHLVKTGLQDYYNSHGFVELDTPTFTPNACEGTTDLFEVQYFDRKAYLTQNGQLYLEALCMAFGKVYDLCPNFRAEKSKTRKHLTEFWSLNPEIAFVEHEESLKIQEESLKHMVRYVLTAGAQELAILERDQNQLTQFTEQPFVQLTYAQAVERLQGLGSAMHYGDDFGAEEEELLTRDLMQGTVIKEWPKALKSFYVKQHPSDPNLVLNADVLAPMGFGEIIGGSQREDDYETLRQNILAHKLPLADFEWYLDLRRYGSVPHSGFGLGIERLTRWVTGIHHIRETIPFPRLINRVTP